ncbi:hypothetical protein [Arthrobacter sp. UYCu712]|uniref:hypothetical protein n=1 Tax=Arthrobacter sp. UYCu712 TaxID=3156340 RepID=UPI0033977382
MTTTHSAPDNIAALTTAPETTATGKRAEGRTPYLEAWAQRYHRSQLAIERGRLKAGRAKHRAHRDPLPGKPAKA